MFFGTKYPDNLRR